MSRRLWIPAPRLSTYMMKTTTFRTIVGLLVLTLSASAAFAAGGSGRMSDRALAAIESNDPAEWADLVLTYCQLPGSVDRAKVKAWGGHVRKA